MQSVRDSLLIIQIAQTNDYISNNNIPSFILSAFHSDSRKRNFSKNDEKSELL
jgi:hypothetical protein